MNVSKRRNISVKGLLWKTKCSHFSPFSNCHHSQHKMIYSLGLGQAVSLFCLWEDIFNFFQLQETIIHANSFQYENTINQHQHTLSVSYMIQSIAAVSAGGIFYIESGSRTPTKALREDSLVSVYNPRLWLFLFWDSEEM